MTGAFRVAFVARMLNFRKSSNSGASCVEVASAGDEVFVRNSRVADGPVHSFTLAEWIAFIDGVKHGEFDLDRLREPQRA